MRKCVFLLGIAALVVWLVVANTRAHSFPNSPSFSFQLSSTQTASAARVKSRPACSIAEPAVLTTKKLDWKAFLDAVTAQPGESLDEEEIPWELREENFDKLPKQKTECTQSPPEWIESMCASLALFASLAEKYQLHYVLHDGSLLGAIREGRHLPWEHDIDVGFHAEEHRLFVDMVNKHFTGRGDHKGISSKEVWHYPVAQRLGSIPGRMFPLGTSKNVRDYYKLWIEFVTLPGNESHIDFQREDGAAFVLPFNYLTKPNLSTYCSVTPKTLDRLLYSFKKHGIDFLPHPLARLDLQSYCSNPQDEYMLSFWTPQHPEAVLVHYFGEDWMVSAPAISAKYRC